MGDTAGADADHGKEQVARSLGDARSTVDAAIPILGRIGRLSTPSGLLRLYELWLKQPKWLISGTPYEDPSSAIPEFLALEDDLRITANLIDGIGLPEAFARLVRYSSHPSGPRTHLAVTYAPNLAEALRLQIDGPLMMVPHMSFGASEDDGRIHVWTRPRLPLGLVGDFTGAVFSLTILRTLDLYAFHRGGHVQILCPASGLAEQFSNLGIVETSSPDGVWGVRFPRDWTDQPNVLFDGPLWDLASQRLQPDSGPGRDVNMVGRLRASISKAIDNAGEAPRLRDVANALGQSTRGLERSLAKAGVTLRDLVQYERKMRALELLADPACTIEGAAERLGFADRASFSRTFTAWFGAPPARYRKNAQ